MKILRERRKAPDKVELPMTPMIDVVFQLLVFFIMTFKIATLEGDFNIKMPLELSPAAGLPNEDELLPMRVRLRAAADGRIAQISLNEHNFGVNFDSLRNHIIGVIGDERGPGDQESAEVELECDFNLRYEHVIETITAVSGYLDDHGNIVKLVEKVKFAPPRAGG